MYKHSCFKISIMFIGAKIFFIVRIVKNLLLEFLCSAIFGVSIWKGRCCY